MKQIYDEEFDRAAFEDIDMLVRSCLTELLFNARKRRIQVGTGKKPKG